MAVVKLQWSNLLKLTELDFQPDFPAQLNISDEVLQTISWLTGTTGYDRRLLRCTPQGALLVAKAWSIMHLVQAYELFVDQGGSTDTPELATNEGVLISSATQCVLVGFKRVSTSDWEMVYVPPGEYYWYPYSCYMVKGTTVPTDTGTASYIGVTVFKK